MRTYKRFLSLCLMMVLLSPPAWAAQVAGEATIRLSFMGDCVIGGEEKSHRREDSFISMVAEQGLDWPFSGVLHLLESDDLSIINFEGVLKDDTRNKVEKRLHWFRGPTELAQVLPLGSIEVAGLANNHARDYGLPGLKSTRQALNDAGIATFGYGEIHTVQVQGVLLGFGGIRETTWRQQPDVPGQEISRLKELGCDYIIYTIHAGKEYESRQNDRQRKLARAVIDAGADLVVGAHPHVVQSMERYSGGLILYSLGNFVFGGNLNLKRFEGLLAQVELQFEGGSLMNTRLNLIPVLTTGTRPGNDFRPVPAKGTDKIQILAQVQAASRGLTIKEHMDFPAIHSLAEDKDQKGSTP